MKHLVLVFLTYSALAADSWFAGRWALQSEPRAVPLVVVCALLMWHDWRAILWAALVGLASDAISGDRLGVQMLAAVLLVSGCRRVLGTGPAWDLLRFPGLCCLVTCGMVAADVAVQLLNAPAARSAADALAVVLETAVATALLGAAIRSSFWVFARLCPGWPVERDVFRNEWSMLTD